MQGGFQHLKVIWDGRVEVTFDIGALEEQVEFLKSEIQLRVFKFCLFYQKISSLCFNICL